MTALLREQFAWLHSVKEFPETNEITAAATVILLVSQELHRYEPSRIQLTSPTQCHRVGHTGTGRRRQYLLYTGIKCMLDPYRIHIPMQTLKSLTSETVSIMCLTIRTRRNSCILQSHWHVYSVFWRTSLNSIETDVSLDSLGINRVPSTGLIYLARGFAISELWSREPIFQAHSIYVRVLLYVSVTGPKFAEKIILLYNCRAKVILYKFQFFLD